MANEYEKLKNLQVITVEAQKALNDKNMTIDNSKFAPQLKKVLETGNTDYLEFKDYATAFGISMLPLGAIGSLAYLIHKKNQKNKIKNEKLSIYKKAVSCQNNIIKALLDERNSDKKRIDLLTSINMCLSDALKRCNMG